MSDVFVSYKREDAAKVRKLVTALRGRGVDVWWDEDIPASAPWEATIEKALANAAAVIVCWSPASVASENVRSEARVARQDGRLIQVFLKPCMPPLFFGERQGIDLSKWRGSAEDPNIAKISDAVSAIAAGEESRHHFSPIDGLRRSFAKKRLLIAALAVALIAAGFVIGYRMWTPPREPQVAVLPFEDLSPAHDKAYFAEGVAEEILSSLSTNKAIKVLGRTSSRQIDRDADPKQLRRSLGITHLLEGSARTAGEALRVNVRLIDTRDGSTVWQDEYQGRLSDVFTVQDRIASAVVSNVRGIFSRAGASAERPVTKVDVYQSYLAARSIMRNRTEAKLREALAFAKQAVDADPTYAPGQALYAELVWMLSDDPDSYGTIPANVASRIAEQHARAAIRLAPYQADGYAALGLIQLVDEQVADGALEHAIKLDPSRADVRIWLAIRLTKAGRYDEALRFSREAVTIEPLWQMPVFDLVVRLAVDGRLDEVRQMARLFRSRGGSEAQYRRFLFTAESRGPDVASAIAQGEKAIALNPSLPNIREDLAALYSTLRLKPAIPAGAAGDLWAQFYRHDVPALNSSIREAGARIWAEPDSGIAFFHLAAGHDWPTLNRLFDQRPMPAQKLCYRNLEAARAIVPALRAARRSNDIASLVGCLRERISIEKRQKSRSWYAFAGDFEFDQATLAAINGDDAEAIEWLSRAVDRGWLGLPYSPELADWPQFDHLRADPRLARLQVQIDSRIVQERSKVVSARR